MKSNSIFAGVILIGFGIYFFLSQTKIQFFEGFYSWPTLLCIVGIAFLLQAYKAKNNESILPGIIFFGFGIHFHIVQTFKLWSNEIGVFILIIALGSLLQASKTKNGMLPGILLLVVSLFLLFNEKIVSWIGLVGTDVGSSFSLWPFLLVGLGVILLFLKK